MPNDDAVDRNLQGMNELDFVGWNKADWPGVFAHYHTEGLLKVWLPPVLSFRQLDRSGRRRPARTRQG